MQGCTVKMYRLRGENKKTAGGETLAVFRARWGVFRIEIPFFGFKTKFLAFQLAQDVLDRAIPTDVGKMSCDGGIFARRKADCKRKIEIIRKRAKKVDVLR